MKLLATIHNSDVHPGTSNIDPSGFRTREAARAIVFDGRRVALLHVTKDHYYKLPGGGVESGEDLAAALTREVLEEIGCHINVTGEVGQIIEYRDQWGLKQTSHCYAATKVGASQEPSYTDDERDRGFEIVWAESLETAVKLVRQTGATDYEGPFIARRDSLLLEAVQDLLPAQEERVAGTSS